MDKTAINLKLFILIPVFFLISLCGHSQDQKSQATERREARRIKTEQSFRDLETLLERKRFSIKLEQSLSDAWKLNMLHNLMEVDSSKWRFYYKKEYIFT